MESRIQEQAIGLLEQYRYEYALLDKAYDRNEIIRHIEQTVPLLLFRADQTENSLGTMIAVSMKRDMQSSVHLAGSSTFGEYFQDLKN
jgi:hypothetical protein